MNIHNAHRLRSTLPPSISQIIGDHTLVRRTMGRSDNRVFAVGKDLYLKISPHLSELRRERDTAIWLEGKLPGHISTPRVGAYDEKTSHSDGVTYGYLLTTTVPGTPACSPPYIKDPVRLCELLAEGLHIFHSLSAKGCPVLPAEDEVQGDPAARVVIHGDFCLPNIILHRNRVSGFVDIGQVTAGDPWEDYAWCLWSLSYNLKTHAYDQLLLDKIGISFNQEKYDAYIPH